MRIISLNVNGIRAAARKGIFNWLQRQAADIICFQEVRALPEQLTDPIYTPRSYYNFYEPALRKGYSGVAIFARQVPDKLIHGFGSIEFDSEGRYLEARFGNLSVISVYLPSGSSKEERQQAKYRFMNEFFQHLKKLKKSGREYIICGDWNIVHKEIDIRNWRSNQKNSGCLPEERAWLDSVFDKLDFVDAFRVINKKPDQYTWWSNRGKSWENNVGWRIDYQIVTPRIASSIKKVSIYKRKRFSDHAPLLIDYDYD
ncbi:MAG: exodeoxyribonuclease III [Pseudomonadota bacterium]|nr:exodeoxyribonuclease III [Pseudomonadota bacterium]